MKKGERLFERDAYSRVGSKSSIDGKWAIAGPVIAEMLNEDINRSTPKPHHEDTPSFEKSFLQDRESFLDTFLKYTFFFNKKPKH